MQALKAAQEKNKDGILSAGEVINKACDACHERYLRQ
jgi:cytochrome c556